VAGIVSMRHCLKEKQVVRTSSSFVALTTSSKSFLDLAMEDCEAPIA